MDDKQIQIGQLTMYQHHLLDKIWSCKTQADLDAWLDTLPTNVLREARALVELLILEGMEEKLTTMGRLEVKGYLKKFML